MLCTLSIRNYAIIDALEIDFSGQMNVITGETGAGKSIIIGALGLILGERADSSVLVNKEKKSIIEGRFRINNTDAIRTLFEEMEWDLEDEILIRREINNQGKSRAFVNDTPVTLTQLQKLSVMLVDLHRQFDTLEITGQSFQRQVLDAMAGQQQDLVKYQKLFQQWQQLQQEIAALRKQQQQFQAEADYNRFQFTELEEAAFKENELEDIDNALKKLSHAEGIKNALQQATESLEESDTPIVAQLKSIIQVLQPFQSFDESLSALLQRLQTAYVELQDVAGDMDRLARQVSVDPEEMDRMSERLSLGYKLQKKHAVNSTIALLEIKNQLEEKLSAVGTIDDSLQEKEKQWHSFEKELRGLADKLHAGRLKQIKPLQDAVNKLLARVGMPNAAMQVSLTATELRYDGADAIDFLFDGNKSGQFHALGKVASGGELSRLMLCIKSLIASRMDLPTLIFDEIDTGISGEAAKQAGIIMKELAQSRQIICITHQPQIAGKGDAHYFVYKDNDGAKVHTHIRQLTQTERISHIAQMLSGDKPTTAALENARELVTG